MMKKPANPAESTLTAHPPCTVGPTAYDRVWDAVRFYGNRALLIGGEKALAAGLYPLEKALDGCGVTLSVWPFQGEATREVAKEAAASAKSLGADIVFGMGGGRAIDTAKAAAHWAGLPVMAFPTIPATCAAVTALAVLHQPGKEACDPFLFLDAPPGHVFLHTGILAAAPDKYLRAGIGDSIAKHVESAFKAGREALAFGDSLGLAMAAFGYETLLRVGEGALQDAGRGLDTPAFRLACGICVINTGIVSLLVQERFNGGLAHALFYVLRDVPGFDSLLHGEAVAWGCLVQLAVENKLDEAGRLRGSLRALGLPVSLRERGIDLGLVLSRLPQALAQPDLVYTPYPVSLQSVQDALTLCEAQSLERGTC